MSDTLDRCCVEGCECAGTHQRTFTIAGLGFGEVEKTASFCCDHIDHLDSEDAPFLDLTVAGRIRA